LKKAEVDEFTTHADCGAFKAAYPGESDSNRSCREWGEVQADKLGIKFRFIEKESICRPDGFHSAVAAYYDGSGGFSLLEGLPRGFVVSRKAFSTGPSDLAFYLKIAFGSHGFGELFTPQSPFHVVVLGHPTDATVPMSLLKKEAEAASQPYGSRVKLESVLAVV
jgi:hypothetical protein